jgi:hypothetical protein
MRKPLSMANRRWVSNDQPTRWNIELTEWIAWEDGDSPWPVWKDKIIARNLTLEEAERRIRVLNRRQGPQTRFSYSGVRVGDPTHTLSA